MPDLDALRRAMESEQECTYHIPANGPYRPAEHIPIRITAVYDDWLPANYKDRAAIECIWLHDSRQRIHRIIGLSTIQGCITIEQQPA
jgi:hypothetical protein